MGTKGKKGKRVKKSVRKAVKHRKGVQLPPKPGDDAKFMTPRQLMEQSLKNGVQVGVKVNENDKDMSPRMLMAQQSQMMQMNRYGGGGFMAPGGQGQITATVDAERKKAELEAEKLETKRIQQEAEAEKKAKDLENQLAQSRQEKERLEKQIAQQNALRPLQQQNRDLENQFQAEGDEIRNQDQIINAQFKLAQAERKMNLDSRRENIERLGALQEVLSELTEQIKIMEQMTKETTEIRQTQRIALRQLAERLRALDSGNQEALIAQISDLAECDTLPPIKQIQKISGKVRAFSVSAKEAIQTQQDTINKDNQMIAEIQNLAGETHAMYYQKQQEAAHFFDIPDASTVTAEQIEEHRQALFKHSKEQKSLNANLHTAKRFREETEALEQKNDELRTELEIPSVEAVAKATEDAITKKVKQQEEQEKLKHVQTIREQTKAMIQSSEEDRTRINPDGKPLDQLQTEAIRENVVAEDEKRRVDEISDEVKKTKKLKGDTQRAVAAIHAETGDDEKTILGETYIGDILYRNAELSRMVEQCNRILAGAGEISKKLLHCASALKIPMREFKRKNTLEQHSQITSTLVQMETQLETTDLYLGKAKDQVAHAHKSSYEYELTLTKLKANPAYHYIQDSVEELQSLQDGLLTAQQLHLFTTIIEKRTLYARQEMAEIDIYTDNVGVIHLNTENEYMTEEKKAQLHHDVATAFSHLNSAKGRPPHQEHITINESKQDLHNRIHAQDVEVRGEQNAQQYYNEPNYSRADTEPMGLNVYDNGEAEHQELERQLTAARNKFAAIQAAKQQQHQQADQPKIAAQQNMQKATEQQKQSAQQTQQQQDQNQQLADGTSSKTTFGKIQIKLEPPPDNVSPPTEENDYLA